uniref:Monocarboxylate transporter n=1 Tax=Anoplophora glabripennis TaxID=217634 RepID=V5GMZ1_ANOGL
MSKPQEREEFMPPDGGYGWVIVFANILINSSLLTLVQCFGIIYKDEFSSMGITAAETSFLLHLHSSLYCSFGFFGSPLLKTYGFRVVAFAGASLMIFGIFLSSFANSYGFLILSISILIGLGQGILMPATYLATYTYFKKRLTVAISLSATGASLFLIFMPKVCDILLTHVRRKYTVLILFTISLLSLVGCYLLKTLNTGSNESDKSVELLNKNNGKLEENANVKEEENKLMPNSNPVYRDTTIPAKKEESIAQKIYSLFDLELLKQTSYVLVVIGLGISFAAELNVILMMQFVLPELSGFLRSDVAFVTSVQYTTDIIGRLAIPLVSHYFEVAPKIMYGGALVAATVARTVLALCGKSGTTVYMCCALLGLTKGARAVFQSVIIPKYVPLEKLPAANGLNMLFTGVVSLMVGPIIGAIHDATNSYVPALHTASALSCICVILWVSEFVFSKCKTVPDDG